MIERFSLKVFEVNILYQVNDSIVIQLTRCFEIWNSRIQDE